MTNQRNAEVKLCLNNVETYDQVKCKIDAMCLPNEVFKQKDIFYKSDCLFKLRLFEDNSADLISYSRDVVDGVKLSSYSIYKAKTNAIVLSEVLGKSLEIKGVVMKQRHLYMCGQTRIHLDIVQNLGYYLELEVVLREEQTVDEGIDIANTLLKKLSLDSLPTEKESYLKLIQMKEVAMIAQLKSLFNKYAPKDVKWSDSNLVDSRINSEWSSKKAEIVWGWSIMIDVGDTQQALYLDRERKFSIDITIGPMYYKGDFDVFEKVFIISNDEILLDAVY